MVNAIDHVLLVHNKDAGDSSVRRGALVALLESRGLSVRACETSPGAIRAALADRPTMAVAAGGDGTVALVVTLAAGTDVPVAPLAMGGLNNIANAFDMSGSIESIVAGWRAARRESIDCGRVSGVWGEARFVEAVGFGPLTAALADVAGEAETAAEKLAKGREAFRRSLGEAAEQAVTVTLDGERHEVVALGLEVLNLPAIGPRLRLAPNAHPGDGRFDVVIIEPDDRAPLMRWVAAHCPGDPPLRARLARRIEVTGFASLRIDDPKREKETQGAPVVIEPYRSVDLILPAHVPGAAP